MTVYIHSWQDVGLDDFVRCDHFINNDEVDVFVDYANSDDADDFANYNDIDDSTDMMTLMTMLPTSIQASSDLPIFS